MSDLEESLNNLKKQADVQQAEITLMRKALEETLERLEIYQAPNYDEEFVNFEVDPIDRTISRVF